MHIFGVGLHTFGIGLHRLGVGLHSLFYRHLTHSKAQAFLTDATPIKSDFIDYGLDATFLADLQTLITDFENSFAAPGTAIDQHVAATAETGSEIRLGMIAVRTMEGAVKNKYRSNVGKLAAWLSASHIDKMTQKKKPIPPPV